jgi:hypothetical protein
VDPLGRHESGGGNWAKFEDCVVCT